MSDSVSEPVGDLQTALAHTFRLLSSDPALAADQAREILRVVPDQPQAILLLGTALRVQGQVGEALEVLTRLAALQPKWAPGLAAQGLSLADVGRTEEAIAALSNATALDPRLPQAWRSLGDLLNLAGRGSEAEAAYARHILASVNDPVLMQAGQALCDGALPVAEHLLREHLIAHPTDVVAIRMLAETGARLGRYEDAEHLLARCLELAPGFEEARHNYAMILQRQNKPVEALAEVDRLLAATPRNAAYLSLKAAALGRTGDQDQAAALYAQVLAQHPDQPKIWMSYGHALKAVGRTGEGVEAYRRAVALAPALGEAWWSLANLKTFRFAPDDLVAMRGALAGEGLDQEDVFHLHFALGKALEDQEAWAESFEHYAKGNALRREALGYRADETTEHVRRSKALFTRGFFAERAGWGSPAPDPIFVIGLPRSGSTLVEQILASHSTVEGATELPDISLLAKRIGGQRGRGEGTLYPEALAELSPQDLAALGQEYLDRTRVHRKSDRPLFIDKMPNNWTHAGLIHLILPNAKIIDVRRHPLACGFSGFKQHFARGQGFAYDLGDLGRWYADYVDLMAHVDGVLPGRIHRVIYERLVADPEVEVPALIAHCGLDFEPACLRFWETERTVRTASSEQVRQPIYTDAVDHWRHYEPWLDPLKAALGPVLEAYPRAP